MTPNAPATVAVVMPTRNQVRFIEASIRSVLSQAADDLRLIVQDGASTDGTPALLERLASQTPALDVRSEPDAGPADALNRAFTRALADPATRLFGWLNSDDLYTAGALARVQAHFGAHPNHVAVYGEGLHVDIDGAELGPYPTRGPEAPLADWSDGCHVCQPTMWLRREALEALMPLDGRLKAAFDYEWWLRLLTRFPGRVGKIDAVQAHSRLHDEGITLSQRRRVALEAVQVIHRHLGPAPGHWLLTCADELRATLPDGAAPALSERLMALLQEAAPFLSEAAIGEVRHRWAEDVAVRSALPEAVVDVSPDGWLGAATALRTRVLTPGHLCLQGRHDSPLRQPLTLTIRGEAGRKVSVLVQPGQPFSLRFALRPGGLDTWTVEASATFVPAELEPGSQDTRRLSCRLERLRWEPAGAPGDNAQV